MRKLALILIPLLVLACGREPVAPSSGVSPTFSFMNGPATPGIYVVRFENFNFLTFYGPFETTPDGDSWVVWVGLPNPPTDWCDGLANLTPTSVQRVQQEARTNVIRLRASALAFAWHWDEFANEFDANGLCSALALTRVAAGTASERSTDNDLFGQTGYNAWGFMMDGELTFQGRTYKTQAVERFQFVQPQGFRFLVSQYRIW